MGKGAGNCFTKPEPAAPAPAPIPAKAPTKSAAPAPAPKVVETPPPAPVKAAPVQVNGTDKMVKIYIIYYSMYGHVAKLAEQELAGANSVDGVEAILYQVPEILPEEVLAKMHAPPKSDVPIADVHDLPNADGFLFGFPTRFGMPAAQFKAFWDATGQHWAKGSLIGKPAGCFFSTATQGGGQETTALTMVTQLTAHGIIFVPTGYSFGGPQFKLDAVQGGSPYGAGTFAGGDGSRQPSEDELAYAKHQGAYFAKVVKKLAAKE